MGIRTHNLSVYKRKLDHLATLTIFDWMVKSSFTRLRVVGPKRNLTANHCLRNKLSVICSWCTIPTKTTCTNWSTHAWPNKYALNTYVKKASLTWPCKKHIIFARAKYRRHYFKISETKKSKQKMNIMKWW